jgi:hypothetical protein
MCSWVISITIFIRMPRMNETSKEGALKYMDIHLNLIQVLYVGLRDVKENGMFIEQAANSFTG